MVGGELWLYVPDAAARASVRPDTIRKWARRGKVQAHDVGGRLMVRWADVARAEHATRGRYAKQRASVL